MTDPKPCCVPQREPISLGAPRLDDSRETRRATGVRRGQVEVPAQRFAMGDHFDEGYLGDGERPVHHVSIDAFSMDATTVTNAQFATFVKATGHRTTAEHEGSSSVFHLQFGGDPSLVLGRVAAAPWWLMVRGATWRAPQGPGSDVSSLPQHPVVHVSYDDALAYCDWANARLPTEAEWEAAARGGLTGARYAWGDDLIPGKRWPLNIFQGDFPGRDDAEDGWAGTAPVKAYQPQGYGLHQMAGNVWEWCHDWFGVDYYGHSPEQDPQGPDHGLTRVMRGGSYLCHDSYCNRYRVAARSSAPPDSSAGNLGFRCVTQPPRC